MYKSQYTRVAMILHWLMAVLILALIPMGLWMSEAVKDPAQQETAYRLFQVHKAIGLSVLLLTLVRLAWRVFHRPPSYPSHMRQWERLLSRAVQAAFYALMILIPLTGWIYVSTDWAVGFDKAMSVATSWFGLIPVPHLPLPSDVSARRDIAFQAMGTHETLAWLMVALIVMHVLAALKHQFFDRDGVLGHMVPGLPYVPAGLGGFRDAPGTRTMAVVMGLLLVLMVAIGAWMTTRIPGGFVPPRTEATATADRSARAGARPAARKGARTAAAPAPAAPAASAPMQPGTATAWTVQSRNSSIRFTGTSSGRAFRGRFDTWSARIWFDPANLPGSRAEVIIQTASAKTGDATQTTTLAAPEWFDAQSFPTARFVATEFTALGGERYQARGTLYLKGKAVPVVMPFTYRRARDVAWVDGTVQLNRTALNMGQTSDPVGQWVSQLIEVTVAVTADATVVE